MYIFINILYILYIYVYLYIYTSVYVCSWLPGYFFCSELKYILIVLTMEITLLCIIKSHSSNVRNFQFLLSLRPRILGTNDQPKCLMRSLSISPHVIHGFRESMLGFQEVHSIPVCWLIVITFPTEKRGLTVIHEEICFILAMKCWFAKAFRTACFELLIGKIITSDYVSICGYSTSYFFCS